MAEFQEVMRQLNRMCLHYQNCGDSGCPLFDECGNIGSHSSNAKQAMRIEKIVMSWAAEHSEPVYPTWLEWLHETLPQMKGLTDHQTVEVLLINSIPADIAQKLCLKPKDGEK